MFPQVPDNPLLPVKHYTYTKTPGSTPRLVSSLPTPRDKGVSLPHDLCPFGETGKPQKGRVGVFSVSLSTSTSRVNVSARGLSFRSGVHPPTYPPRVSLVRVDRPSPGSLELPDSWVSVHGKDPPVPPPVIGLCTRLE